MEISQRIFSRIRRFIASGEKLNLARSEALRATLGPTQRYPLRIIDSDHGFGFAIDCATAGASASEKVAPVWSSGQHLIDWAVCCLEMNYHGASKAARKWISECAGGAAVTAVELRGQTFVSAAIDPNAILTMEDKFELARTVTKLCLKQNNESIRGETLTAGVVQYLCLHHQHQQALDFLALALSYAETVFLSMLRTAVELRTHGPVPKYIDELLGADGHYFNGRFCAKPFTDFEVTPTGAAYICCPNYLPTPIGNINDGNANDLINSPTAARIRRSIIEGNFGYCDWTKCAAIKNDSILTVEEASSDPLMEKYIRAGDGHIEGPTDVRLSYDSTCNLSCPSCRTEMIVAKGKQFDEIMRVTDVVVRPLLHTARTVMMNGYGDIFSSRSCRRILESVSPETHPKLKLVFITNGVLLTEHEWSKFPKIRNMVDTIRVSIDAANEDTYNIVRRGGDFEKLKRNLNFIARLRNEELIRTFAISFVVQRQNFREMAAFCRWGSDLGCDFIIFEVIQNWNTFSDYASHAVHLPSHPLHGAYLAAVAEVEAVSGSKQPGDRWMLSADFGYVIR
jgi:molybdenum cofactor biosynthesis enzyme MoaA